jgi:nitroreductase
MSEHDCVYPADSGPFAGSLDVVDSLLTTTRSVRRRLDLTRPVPRPVIEECLQLAIHAPNAEGKELWRWLVLTDTSRKLVLAEYLRGAWIGHMQKTQGIRRDRFGTPSARIRNVASAQYLVDNLERVPAIIIPCMLRQPLAEGEARQVEVSWGEDPDAPGLRRRARLFSDATYYGSIFPAMWSLQLAFRSRGLGSTIITSHLIYHEFIAAELGIPKQVRQIALMPVAYTAGTDFQPARRIPAEKVTIWNEWGRPRGDAALRDVAMAWIRDSNLAGNTDPASHSAKKAIRKEGVATA